MKRIGITGGVACGKSTFCSYLAEAGATVVSADKIVHELLNNDTSIQQQVLALFGTLDRTAIASKVFSDPTLLAKLEPILHPAVRAAIAAAADAATTPLFAAEIPLLFEGGLDSQFDVTIVVAAPEEQCRLRFGSASDYDRRMARQLPLATKIAKATYVIHNDRDKQHLRDEAFRLYDLIC